MKVVKLSRKRSVSISIVGTDTGGQTYKARTDGMMIVILNPGNNKITIVNIPRDTAVTIPDFVVIKLFILFRYFKYKLN